MAAEEGENVERRTLNFERVRGFGRGRGRGAGSWLEALKGSLREGEVVGLYLYLQFFWDFVTGNRRKSLGIGVFLAGRGIRSRVGGRDD